MQSHNIKKNRANRKAKQVGRGGTRGKTSGRGTKGQNARSGRKKRPEWRDIIKRLPKLRGRGKNFLKSRFSDYAVVRLGTLQNTFEEGTKVDIASLLDKKLISSKSGVTPRVKILVGGKITKAFNISGLYISKTARAIVEKVGGSVSLEAR